MARKFSRVLSVRNEDGSICVFRLCCLLVLAACMLAYGCVLAAQDEGGNGAAAQKPSAQASAAAPSKDEGETDASSPEGVRALAFREIDEADEYYRGCGSVNEGFVGCSWKFSPEVSKYYEGRSVAADDGFAITLRAKPGNPDKDKCALLEATSDGSRTSLDGKGRASDCFPHEKPQVASNSGAPSAGAEGNGKI